VAHLSFYFSLGQHDIPKRNPLRFFDIDHTLEQLMALFSKELNKHRVCVKEGNEVVAVISQFGVLQFLHGILPKYPHMAYVSCGRSSSSGGGSGVASSSRSVVSVLVAIAGAVSSR
jgi:hypothetical protein